MTEKPTHGVAKLGGGSMSSSRTESLRDDEVERYRQDGFLMGGKVISDETVEELSESITKLSEAPGAVISEDLAKREDRNSEYKVDYLTFLWKSIPICREVAFSPRIAKMAAQLLCTDRVVLIGDAAFIKPPEKGGKMYFHQDGPTWPTDSSAGLTCWIALDEVNPENGSMVFAAGSHLLGERLPVNAPTGETLSRSYVGGDRATEFQGRDLRESGLAPLTSPEEEGLSQVSTYYHPGECSFHSSLTWHASGYNTSDRYRRAFSMRYVDGNTRWLGSQKWLYYVSDDEAGIEVGDPIGGPHFPTVWPPADAK
jgi:phytanoyl-CoA hydroxylase